jgi:hypothetical protein
LRNLLSSAASAAAINLHILFTAAGGLRLRTPTRLPGSNYEL